MGDRFKKAWKGEEAYLKVFLGAVIVIPLLAWAGLEVATSVFGKADQFKVFSPLLNIAYVAVVLSLLIKNEKNIYLPKVSIIPNSIYAVYATLIILRSILELARIFDVVRTHPIESILLFFVVLAVIYYFSIHKARKLSHSSKTLWGWWGVDTEDSYINRKKKQLRGLKKTLEGSKFRYAAKLSFGIALGVTIVSFSFGKSPIELAISFGVSGFVAFLLALWSWSKLDENIISIKEELKILEKKG